MRKNRLRYCNLYEKKRKERCWSKVFLQPAPLPEKEVMAGIFRNFSEQLFLQAWHHEIYLPLF